MKKFYSLLFYLICCNALFAQDTLVVYFEVNSAGLSYGDRLRLHTISTEFDLSSLDSIHFIGYADSTGNLKSNLRLSERRAQNTYKECKSFIEEETPIRIMALGENIRKENWQSRRVEIILFYPEPDELVEAAEIIKDVDPKCFFVDFEALEYCNVREFSKGKRTYVQIEALNIPLFKERKHYYVLYDNKGKATVQRLNWKLKTTGRLWWKKQRWVATIPKVSYDKFQFFTLDNAPCTGCSETIFTKDTIVRTVLKYYPDVFLMNTMQTRIQFFGRSKMKIRVPKEYVDLSESYFYSRSPYSPLLNAPIEWTEKNGRRKENYYYTTIYAPLFEPIYIKKMSYTTICLNKYEYSGYQPNWMNCGYIRPSGDAGNIALRFGPSAFFHNDTLTAVVTGGIKLWGFYFNAGLNHRGGFYSSIYYNRTVFAFPLSAISPKNKWQSLSESPRIRRYGIIYGGADIRTSYTKKYQSFLEGNLHLGTLLWYGQRSAFQYEFFLQGGYAYDFLKRINTLPYPYIEVGLRFDLGQH